jgi:SRSO17 transposase
MVPAPSRSQELVGWGRRPPLIVADCGYGDAAEFRHGLTERGLAYVIQVSGRLTTYPAETARTAPEYCGVGPYPQPRYRDPAPTLADLITAAGAAAARRVSWRPGSRHRAGRRLPMSSRFVFIRVRPAGRFLLTPHRGQDLPETWLLAEWPPGADEPIKYWLSNLPERIAKRTLVRWAKLRWRIEHDYREIKTGLGLDHYEGRTWQGWHHHVTLVSAAHTFLTLQRLDPKPVRRNDPLRGTPTPATAARLPDRCLPDLPNPFPATEKTTPPKIMTKHYSWPGSDSGTASVWLASAPTTSGSSPSTPANSSD